MSSSLVFVIPYFGRWPFWMPYFLRSCASNPDIDWLLYSDCGKPFNLPANVRYRQISFSEYCAFVSERLSINFAPEQPYKLCDLKPALGHIHESDIAPYDFWGFSDLDLIYGDLRRYFNEQRLAQFDFFSTHERRVSGHLCLMRNAEKMRRAFLKTKNYLPRLCEQQHYALDEGAFSKLFIRHKNFPDPLFHFMAQFNTWRRRALFEELFSTPNAGKPWVDGSFDFPSTWFWREGVVTNNLTGARSFPYFHFLGWKTFWHKHVPLSQNEVNRVSDASVWEVDKDGFHLVE
ncbi:MAG: DUF6625 family protein [Pseudomonas sp.]|uniref:DUF6625 family protein n=1 Tax=Pseudomonas sp. TaxID=306 RepID=UPI003D106DA6